LLFLKMNVPAFIFASEIGYVTVPDAKITSKAYRSTGAEGLRGRGRRVANSLI
jgi:hypothetical protein